MTDIHVATLKPQRFAAVKREGPVREIAAMLGSAFDAVTAALAAAEVAPAGPPVARYLAVGDETVTFEAGFPIESEFKPADGVSVIELPGGDVATTLHVGAYDELDAVHVAVETWIADHGRTPAGPPWELYLTDPKAHRDPATWQTEVYWPLAPAA